MYRDSQRKNVALGAAVGRGGEATIYRVSGQPKLLAKIYSQPPKADYLRKLQWMRDHPPDDPTAAQNHASLAWPMDLLYTAEERLAGYLMPYIEQAAPLLDVFNPRRCALVLPEFNRRYLHRTARNLAAALGALHARGYVVGDLNESNILVTPRALVTLIDTDSFQVRETTSNGAVVHPCPVARLEYTPPELQGKSPRRAERSPEQDAFGLAVLIYQLLMAGNHPFRAIWLGKDEPPPLEERIRRGCFPYRKPPICPVAPPPGAPALEELYPLLQQLMLRCFIAGHHDPAQRPTPFAWEKALEEAERNLILCKQGHYYSSHLPACPTCHPRTDGRQIPLPPARSAPRNVAAPTHPAPASAPPHSAPSASSNPAPAPLRLPRFSRIRQGWLARLDRQRLQASLSQGALLGAGIGGVGGALLAILTWNASQELRWSPLLTFGAVLGAAWRSLQIGTGLSAWVRRYVGWEAALKTSLATILAVGGGATGLVIEPGALGAFLGGGMGALSGYLIADALWRSKPRLRWDWIGAAVVVGLLTWLAYLGGTWLGESGFGRTTARWISALATWADGQQVGRTWIALGVGLLGGGIGGALSGVLTECLAEFLGFRR